jgi:hypothetical protein
VAGVELATLPFTDHEVDGRRLQRGPERVELDVGDEYTPWPGHQALSGALLELGELLAGNAAAPESDSVALAVLVAVSWVWLVIAEVFMALIVQPTMASQ